jgi:hypothetical protein
MARIEKTVFISYRRTDEPWALALFQDLTQHGYDVFVDYEGIASGNFETIILENIRARAHFLVLLSPTALERSGDPEDWLRREIEAALDSRRNIVPVMLAGFDFGAPAIASQLTGKLAALKQYNGLTIAQAPAMQRLRDRFLSMPVDVVLHPASDSAQQVATEQKDKAMRAAAPVEEPHVAAEVAAAPQMLRKLSTLELAELRMATGTLAAGASNTSLPSFERDWRQAEAEEAPRQAEEAAPAQADARYRDMLEAARRREQAGGAQTLGRRSHILAIMVGLGLLGLGLWLLGHWGTALFHLLFRSTLPPLPASRDGRAEADIVDASAFAPRFGPAGGAVLVQIFFHRRKQAATTRKLAIQADHEAESRGTCTLEMAVRRGQRISVKLDAPDLLIDQAMQSLTWRGEAAACQFRVAIPAELSGRTSHILASFFLDGAPVGEVRFRLDVLSKKAARPREPELRGESARHFEYAFLSYSSRDQQDVLKCAQALDNAGIKFFMDIVSLRGGEDWEKRLYEEIDRSDLFMLFWSRNIEQSESIWIEREATHALRQQEKSAEHLPTFKPTFLGRQKPQPPSWLPARIQFDNALRRHMLAAARKRARRTPAPSGRNLRKNRRQPPVS